MDHGRGFKCARSWEPPAHHPFLFKQQRRHTLNKYTPKASSYLPDYGTLYSARHAINLYHCNSRHSQAGYEMLQPQTPINRAHRSINSIFFALGVTAEALSSGKV